MSQRGRTILGLVLFLGPLIGIGSWMAIGLMSTSMEACNRYETADHCEPICLQSMGAEEVDESLRARACRHAAEDFEADSKLRGSVAMMETCVAFGGCDQELLGTYECRLDANGCAERCESGALAACESLIPNLGREADTFSRALAMLERACALDSERCERNADDLCDDEIDDDSYDDMRDRCEDTCRQGASPVAATLCFTAAAMHREDVAYWVRRGGYGPDPEDTDPSFWMRARNMHQESADEMRELGCNLDPTHPGCMSEPESDSE